MAREILTNAVRHGNKNDESKTVYVSYYLWKDHMFRLIIEDEGTGFDYFSYLQKIKQEDELRVQHRGIFLIDSFAHKIIPEGNKISIEIKL
jgi:serine/threonine-protein kinase RsbW